MRYIQIHDKFASLFLQLPILMFLHFKILSGSHFVSSSSQTMFVLHVCETWYAVHCVWLVLTGMFSIATFLPSCIHMKRDVKQNSNNSVMFSFGKHKYPLSSVQLIASDLWIHSVLFLGHVSVEYTGNL